MRALPPLAAVFGILEHAVVERISENPVDAAPREHFSSLGSKSPLIRGDVAYLWRRVGAGEHQLPHLAYKIEALGVSRYLFLALLPIFVTAVTNCRGGWNDAHLGFFHESALHVNALFVVFHLRLAALQSEHELIKRCIAERLARRHDLDELPPVHHVHKERRVDGIARQAIGVPSDDSVHLAILNPSEHFRELGTLTRILRGLRLA